MRHWLAGALFAASWLFGLPYYEPANLPAWGALVACGVALLWQTNWGSGLQKGRAAVEPTQRTKRLGGSLALPHAVALAVLVVGLVAGLWPFDMPLAEYVTFVPIGLLAAGFALRLLSDARLAVSAAGATLICAAMVLLVQRIALFGYEAATARSHELPASLAWIVGAVGKLLSLDAGSFDSTVTLHSMREVHRLGAAWELLLDPASLAFWAGGVTYLLLVGRRGASIKRPMWHLGQRVSIFSAIVLLWLPIRVGLLMAIYMHLGLRLDFDDRPDAMVLFWQPWLHGVLLAAPSILAWRFLSDLHDAADEGIDQARSSPPRHRRFASLALASVAGVATGFGLWWDPAGEAKPGRVLVDEFHIGHNPRTRKMIHWEPTTRPFDTEWYGPDAAYNYACIYHYLTHYFHMRRLEPANRPLGLATDRAAEDSLLIHRIDGAALQDCDVLVVKTPTADFSAEEVDSIKRFVKRGGGLLLVGEHTDVFGTGRHLNTLAREFGFAFRYDCLFGIENELPKRSRGFDLIDREVRDEEAESTSPPRTVFDQLYRRPWVPHPVLQYMPPLDFATSASIDPGTSSGRAVIRSTGLWSLPADYHADNYYPQVAWRPDMRYGAFVQLWSTRYGHGRVLAFADSTIFSNFSAFQPGKAELMLGMIDWLNHRHTSFEPRAWLFFLAIAAIALSVYFSLGWQSAVLAAAAVAVGSFLLAAPFVRGIHRQTLPRLVPDESQLTRIVFDRTISEVRLPAGSFIDGRENGFGIFERWMLRLGYFLARARGDEAFFGGDVLVIVNPTKAPSARFRQRLVDYVEEGGKLLVLDSASNRASTANELLAPFEMEFAANDPLEGTLESEKWPSVPVRRAKPVSGGTPIFRIGEEVVGRVRTLGAGKVIALGFSDRFSDANMGVTGDTIPDDDMRKVYDVQYGLMQWIVEEGSDLSSSDE